MNPVSDLDPDDARAERRRARAVAHTRVGTTPSLLGTQGPDPREVAAQQAERQDEQVPGQLSTDDVLADAVEAAPVNEVDEVDEQPVAVVHNSAGTFTGDDPVEVMTRAIEAKTHVDGAKAAGEVIRAEREARAGRPAAQHHGYGFLDTEGFIERLREHRFVPVDEAGDIGVVSVRMSRTMVKALKAVCEDLGVQQRVVLESLLIELVGPSRASGGVGR